MQAKVVIIDDNPITVRSLTHTIDWASRGCVVAGTATDGQSGRALVLRVRPDILLLDIRMPQMDGLDMLGEVRAAVPDCKVIIITGYDQFQYASRAIKLSVFDYILKPIRNAEVEEVVDRALEATKNRREQDIAVHRAQQLAAQAQLLSLMMNESRSGQNVHQMLHDSGLYSESYAMLCVAPSGDAQLPPAALTELDTALEAAGLRAVTALLYDALLIYVMFGDGEPDWQGVVRQVETVLRSTAGVPLRLGVSERMFSHHSIRQAYHQARQVLWEQTLSGEETAAFYQDGDGGQRDGAFVQMHRSVEALAEHADLSDASIDEAAATLCGLAGRQYSNLRALLSLYAIMLCKKFPSSNTHEIDREIGSGLFASSEEEVRACLRRLCDAIRRGRQEKPDSSGSLMTRSVLEYIRLHAAEPLRLSDVAALFHINTNYLSLLIKRETGITFHEHVLRAKMDIAHTLLADPRVRVSEVASAVGYSNYISFYNTFKRLEHMTPTEYRNSVVPGSAQSEPF